jgi:hypothetical protein
MACLIVLCRCAQISPLGGGERDVSPPKLIEAKPLNATTNFTGKTIEFKFDEFVQVKDIANQLVVTPQLKEMPLVEARGKKVLVKFNEELLPNTTYRIFFGNSVADMHEGNVMPNFEYVFSTGPTIDSLQIVGTVKNAFDMKQEKDIMVALYSKTDDDSVMYKKKPLYFSKTSGGGDYKITYLPKERFRAVAFFDKNKNLTYEPGDELIGFKDTLITAGMDSVVNFKIFREAINKLYIKKVSTPFYGLVNVVYNKKVINKVSAVNVEEKDNIYSLPGVSDTAVIFYHNLFDTLKVYIEHGKDKTDTLRVPISTKERFERQKKEKKLRMNIETGPEDGGKISWYQKPWLQFNAWIDTSSIDLSKIKLSSREDTMVVSTPALRMNERVNRLEADVKLHEGTRYELLLNKGALISKAGYENDSMTIVLKTTAEDDYSVLNLKLFLPLKEKYIVQLVNDAQQVVQEKFISLSLASSAEQVFKFTRVWPGQYFLKVIEDKNDNKIWDTGSIKQKKQPETIYFNAQSIKLLAGWDAEMEWKVN